MRNNRFANRDYAPTIISSIVGMALVLVNIIRIFKIPITIDETGVRPDDTYLGLMRNKIGSANNHILHSLFRKFFIDTFGNTLFFLRLDSLVAQLFFLVFSYLICRILFKNKWWLVSSFVILNFSSPLIFDFWGLSRGYALALTFMTISVYYLLRYMDGKKVFFISLSFATAILSVYSNFGYINYFLVLSAVVIIQNSLFWENRARTSIFKELVVIVIASCILALLIVAPLKAVYGFGELRFMGNNGFMKDTLRTVVSAGLGMFGHGESLTTYTISRAVIILTCISGFFWTYTYFNELRREKLIGMETRYGITFFLLLVGHVVSLIAQHLLFGINYLTDRAALFFIILFMLQFIFLLYYLREKYKILTIASFATVFVLLIYNFLSCININTTILWYFDAADLAILKKINSESKDKQGKIKVAISWMSEGGLKYDMESYYPGRFYSPISVSHSPGKDTTFDYYFITITDLPKLPEGYQRDTDCIGGSFILFKKNESLSSAK